MSRIDQAFHPLSVIWSCQEVLNPPRGNRLEHSPWVVGQSPELGVELGPQLVRAAVPRPTQIQRELGERLDPDVLRPAHDDSPPLRASDPAKARLAPRQRRDAPLVPPENSVRHAHKQPGAN